MNARERRIESLRRATHTNAAHLNEALIIIGEQQKEIAELLEALELIEALEKRADACVGMVDYPHTKALRAACKKAREALAKAKGTAA